MAVSIPICNMALGDIRAQAIVTIDDETLEAQMCARYYPHCLSLLFDDYSWEFAKKISTLALLTSNERSSEWVYCYALPADCNQALRLLPTGTAIDYSAYRFDLGNSPLPQWWLNFVVEADKLYTNVADAVLEYASSGADETSFPATFVEALRKLLAANLAIPIRNEPTLADGLFKQAERARASAIANDMNRAPRRELHDDVGWARRG